MVRHTCNSSSWEAEAGGPAILRQPGLHREFQVSINYTSIVSGEKGKKGEKERLPGARGTEGGACSIYQRQGPLSTNPEAGVAAAQLSPASPSQRPAGCLFVISKVKGLAERMST